MIPKQKYTAQITDGEETSLLIRLFGQEYDAVIDFGVTAGMQILDEGVLLCCPNPGQALKKNDFPNSIYLIENEDFSRHFARRMGPELYHDLRYRQYNIVTLNYVISVISQRDPDIKVHLSSHCP